MCSEGRPSLTVAAILNRVLQPRRFSLPNAEYPPRPYPTVPLSPGQSISDDTACQGQVQSSHSSSSNAIATPRANILNGQHANAQSPSQSSLKIVPSSPLTANSLKRKQLPDAASVDPDAADSSTHQFSPTKRSAPLPSPTTRTRRGLRNSSFA